MESPREQCMNEGCSGCKYCSSNINYLECCSSCALLNRKLKLVKAKLRAWIKSKSKKKSGR